MQIVDSVLHILLTFLPPISALIASGTILWACNWLLLGRHPELGNERKFPLQIIMFVLTIVSILAIVITLPIDASFRNQIIGLIGILLSGMIAFSSTNIVANLMAGVLLRITKPFRTGDFIRVGDFFGRVSERGLFDTEIQSENRELVALPNAYLINNPISTIRNSGAIVSATLSLGYDVNHLQVEPLLIKAAEESGLKDPFVHILELGNFSITYRISALLTEVKGLLTARSNLFRSVLTTLHGHDIEIMSPTFMNQRKIADEQKIIPAFVQAAPEKETIAAEDMVFDKAEQAEQIEDVKQTLIDSIKNLEAILKEAKDEQKDTISARIEKQREHLKLIELHENESTTETKTTKPSTLKHAPAP